MAKQPYVRANVSFYLENRPKNYRGIRNDNWQFGGWEPVAIQDICTDIVIQALEFHINTVATGDPVELIGQVIARLETVRAEIVKSKETVQDALKEMGR